MIPTRENDILPSKSFERHLKRTILAPAHRFAVIVPPELSLLSGQEASSLEFSDIGVTDAGVEFSGKLTSAYSANLWLRTASRVLCRLPSFRAGITEELFFKVSQMPWELWLNPDVPLDIDAYVEYSRIEHEGKLGETVLGAIKKAFIGQGKSAPVLWSSEGERQRILVHLQRNHCTISLDTTGAHLHQRGYRPYHAGAPLRETLAAALLLKSGWRGDSPLVDGMTGSGTIAIEAALLARRLPPGANRAFLFEQWPSFQEKTWNYLKRKAVEGALPDAPSAIFGIDLDGEALKLASENGTRAGVSGDIHWKRMDFFQFNPADYGLRPGLLMMNPPYGIRLDGGLGDLYGKIGIHLRRFFKGWRFAILTPDRAAAASLKIRSVRHWKIMHGGIPIVAVLGKID